MEHRPFLKWAGGKTQLLDHLVRWMPPSFSGYHEPFLGGGALLFAVVDARADELTQVSANDLNHHLVTTYAVVRDRVDDLGEKLQAMAEEYLRRDDEAREKYYYDIRREVAQDRVGTAARFIFLNKTCYNGLYRENRRGIFNVPHGRYRSPAIFDADGLRAASALLQNVVLQIGEFTAASRPAQAGDFVYFDPPFQPLSPTSNFTSYTSRDFTLADQQVLANLVSELTERGVHVMLSNSSHPLIRSLYDDARYVVEELPASRRINSRGDRRGPVGELVVMNYHPELVHRADQLGLSIQDEVHAEPVGQI